MRKLLFVTGMFNMILAVLLALGGVIYLKGTSGLDMSSSIADCLVALPVVSLVLIGIVFVLSILIFVNGIMNMTTAIDTKGIAKKERILMNVSNLIITLGAGAFIGYLVALFVMPAIADISIKAALYFGLSIIVLVVMLVLIIVNFAKLPRKPKIKKIKVKKEKPVRQPKAVRVEKKDVVKEEKIEKTEENIVQPNFNFRKRGR